MRTLTVSSLYRGWDRTRCEERVVPALRINGKWLEAHGFHPGDKVRVEYVKGALVVTRSVS